MKYLLYLLMISALLQAKPLEVSQLFNKKTIKVTKQNITLSKIFYADIRIPDDAIKNINIRFDGFVGDLFVNKNYQLIQKGEPLFDIYSDEINLAMGEYLLSGKNLRKNYMKKFQSYGIDNKVLKNLQKTKRVKEYINIYSPYDGYIISKNINDGKFIKKGETLFQVASFKKLWVVAKVYQKDIKSIKKDMKATVYIDGVKNISAKVDFIYPTINQKDKTIDVRIEIENQDLKIFPNMFAKVSINTLQKSMLVLPKTAVLTKANKHYVFIPDGKYFTPKEITATRINSEQFEVIKLKENEVVIDKAAFLLDSDAITNGLYNSSDDDDDW